jgi:hypothetical protein
MTASVPAALVRRWVACYTIGLPDELRDMRRAEVDDDLWSQAHDADPSEPPGSGDVLARLVFGMWADITWRLEQRYRDRTHQLPRSVSMTMRALAALSIIGGTALAIASVISGRFDPTGPVALWRILFVTGFGGLAIGIWGLVARLNDRMGAGVTLLGLLGGAGGAMAGVGVAIGADALGGAFILLAIGSIAVALDLGRDGTLPRRLAIGHAAAGLAVVVILMAIWTGSSIGAAISASVPYTVPWVPYAVTWIGIGAALVRGQPEVDRPVPSQAGL